VRTSVEDEDAEGHALGADADKDLNFGTAINRGGPYASPMFLVK